MAQNEKLLAILLPMRRIRFFVSYVLLLGSLLVLRASTRQDVPKTDVIDSVELQREAEDALDRVQRNDVGQGIVDATSYIELGAHVPRLRAIPVLEAYFARTHESELRNEIASVLVSLGDEDPRFWNLILHEAQTALAENAPDAFGDGDELSGPCTSEALLAWAKKRNLTPQDACTEATVGIGARIRPLADSGDPRVIPVLQNALKASNRMIRMMAVHGLVLTRDRDAITLVIDEIQRSPQAQGQPLVDLLIESDDPRAESVVHQYMPEINFREAHQFRAQISLRARPILTGR